MSFRRPHLLSGEAVVFVAAVDAGETEEDKSFEEDDGFELDGATVQAAEVADLRRCGRGFYDVAADAEAVGFHARDDGELHVCGEGHHGNDERKLDGAGRVGILLQGEQRQREEDVDDPSVEAQAMQREQRAADDHGGVVRVRHGFEGNRSDDCEEDNATDPEGQRDEPERSEKKSHEVADGVSLWLRLGESGGFVASGWCGFGESAAHHGFQRGFLGEVVGFREIALEVLGFEIEELFLQREQKALAVTGR